MFWVLIQSKVMRSSTGKADSLQQELMNKILKPEIKLYINLKYHFKLLNPLIHQFTALKLSVHGTSEKLTVTSTIISTSRKWGAIAVGSLPLEENTSQIQCHLKTILIKNEQKYFRKSQSQDNINGINSQSKVFLKESYKHQLFRL